jgi:hypothetical protein
LEDDTYPNSVHDEFRSLLIEANVRDIGSDLIRWNEAGFNARAVRGRKMKLLQGVFDKFAASLGSHSGAAGGAGCVVAYVSSMSR